MLICIASVTAQLASSSCHSLTTYILVDYFIDLGMFLIHECLHIIKSMRINKLRVIYDEQVFTP
jgi:hypothetical protein